MHDFWNIKNVVYCNSFPFSSPILAPNYFMCCVQSSEMLSCNVDLETGCTCIPFWQFSRNTELWSAKTFVCSIAQLFFIDLVRSSLQLYVTGVTWPFTWWHYFEKKQSWFCLSICPITLFFFFTCEFQTKIAL